MSQITKALDGAIDNLTEAKAIYENDPGMAWIALVAAVALIESVAKAFIRMDDEKKGEHNDNH